MTVISKVTEIDTFCFFQNHGNVKKDILANINCDSEALDKFLRRINELPEWRVGCPQGDLSSLQERERLKEFLSDIHLTEYEEEFLVFASCKEWWCKLPLFNDEEMRIWFGMDKPGHLIRFRTALREQQQVEKKTRGEEDLKVNRDQSEGKARMFNRKDVPVPVDLIKRLQRNQVGEDELLVLFQGALAKLTISSQDIRIAVEETDLHKHNLKELLYVYQDGEDLTRFGYQLVDSSLWEFQTANIVTTARAVLIIAHRFGFE